MPPRLQHFVEFLFKSRIKSFERLKLFEQAWPAGLELSHIPFGTRATNALMASGLIADKDALANQTFGNLLRLQNVGIRTVLEIACLAEAALTIHWQAAAELAKHFATPAAAQIESGGGEYKSDDERPASEGWREILTAALQEPWIDQIDEHDFRFRNLLPPGYGSLEERIYRAISDPASASAEIRGLVQALPGVREAVERMAAQGLEQNLRELLAFAIGDEQPRFDGIASRLGWLGEDPKTLQECGDMLGITRERIRQIEARVIEKLTSHSLYLPNLDAALAIVEGATPIPVSRAATLLAEKNVSRRPFSPRALIDTAKVFGRKTTLAIEDHKGGHHVVSGDQGRVLGVLTRTARKLAGQSGVSSVYKVADAIIDLHAPLGPPKIDEDDIRKILKNQPGYEFLDEDWFWFTAIPEGRNRLENIVKKMLSVASPQSIASLREGVRRAFRWRASTNERYRTLTVPPQAVLAKFLQRHPDFQIDGDLASTVRPLDYRKLLGTGEQIIVDVIRSVSSGVLDRKTLIRECLARGINENTLAVYTSYSTVLDHIGVGLWQLRGVRVDPAAVEAVREQNALRPREVRVQDFGWDANGRLWVTWTLPQISSSPVLGIPGPVKRFLGGRTFEARPKDGERLLGKISITDAGLSYGYSPYYRYSGADEGDWLKAEFDLGAAIVYLSLNEDTFEDDI